MDCLKGSDGASPRGFENGSDVGVEPCSPLGTEAVCDLAKSDTGPDRLLGLVIGGRDGTVLHKDEQVLPAVLDSGLECLAFRMAGPFAQKRIEIGIELARVAAQRAVGKIRSTSPDGTSMLEKLTKQGREDGVAGIDCVLGIADQMGEAELMITLGPALLGTEPIGDPVVRTIVAEELRHGCFAAVWMDQVAAGQPEGLRGCGWPAGRMVPGCRSAC